MATSPHPSRPLSPHLSIYRFHFSMALSILHRVAGIAVAGMLVILIAWICAAAYSNEYFVMLQRLLVSLPGQIVLMAASVVFYFKMATGLRHLLWDTGRAFQLREIDRTGVAAIVFTIVATALTWAIVWEVL